MMQRLSQSPTDPKFVQDPYPFYARARAAGPLIWWQEYKMACATTHEAVNTILRDRRFGREAPEELRPPIPDHLAPFYAVEAHSMLELEPPRHLRLRSLVLRAFTSRRIAGLKDGIGVLCHDLVDAFPAGEFDLLEAYARPLPVTIIARLLGVPEEMGPDLLRWSNAMVGMYMAGRTRADEDAAVAATAAFVDFMRGHIAARRSDPRDDLITSLIAAEEDGDRLSTDELITTCILLLNAGHEATVHSLGNGVKAMLEHGLRGGDAEMVEEILRYDPPLHLFTRHVYDEVELFGHRFQRGDEVGLMLGSVGRDAAVNDRPEMFDPTRAAATHLGFGVGLHFCVGAPLARMEMATALQVLFQRCPGLRLVEQPRYGDIYHFHGLERLMVQC
jgi:cytochrome P450